MLPDFGGSNPYFFAVFVLAVLGSPIIVKVSIDALEDSGIEQVAPLLLGYVLTVALAYSLAVADPATDLLPHALTFLVALLYAVLLVTASRGNDDTVTSADEIVQERL